jgi:hypothetical protein
MPASPSRHATTILVGLLVAACSSSSSPTPITTPAPSEAPAVGSGTSSPTPRPTARPTASPSPTSTPSRIGANWTRIGELAQAGTFGIGSITAFAGGYVFVGPTAGPPTIQVSGDGRSWTAVTLPAPDPLEAPDSKPWYDRWAHATSAATDGTTVVVVGAFAHEPCAWQAPGSTGGGPECPLSPISWVNDGTRWRSSQPWVGPVGSTNPAEGFTQGSEFSSVWPVPGGWEASLFFWQGAATYQREIWWSADGLAWSRRATVFADGNDFTRRTLVDGTGRRVMGTNLLECPGTGAECRTFVHLWTSTDGATWTDLAAPDDLSRMDDGLAPDRAGSPWLIAGARCEFLDDGSDACQPRLWAATEPGDWRAMTLPGSANLRIDRARIARSDLGWVVTAWSWNGAEGIGATWLSGDGEAWTSAPGPPIVTALVDGPAGTIAVGIAGDDGVLPVYQLR